jgi:hypothetical protein
MVVCGESETEVSREEGGYGGISSGLNFGVDDGLDDDSDRRRRRRIPGGDVQVR